MPIKEFNQVQKLNLHPCDFFFPYRTSDGSIPTPMSGPTVCRRSLFSREHVSSIPSLRTRTLVCCRSPASPRHSTAAVLYYYLYKRTAEYMGDPRLYEDSLWLREAFARARQWAEDDAKGHGSKVQTVASVEAMESSLDGLERRLFFGLTFFVVAQNRSTLLRLSLQGNLALSAAFSQGEKFSSISWLDCAVENTWAGLH